MEEVGAVCEPNHVTLPGAPVPTLQLPLPMLGVLATNDAYMLPQISTTVGSIPAKGSLAFG